MAIGYRKCTIQLLATILLVSFPNVNAAAHATHPNRTGSIHRVFPGISWKKAAAPETLGWSLQKLEKARVYSKRIGTAVLMIVDDGLVIAQWGDVAFNYPVHSMRKPFFSALTGIYVHENRIELSDTLERLGIDDVNPPLTTAEKQATVEDLLASRSGVYHPAIGDTELMKRMRPERGSHAPGTFWYYNNWGFNVIGTILEKTTGARVFELLMERIAKPLQMEDFDNGNGKYVYGSESIHRGYALRMSTRDLARFGLLYLRKGKWKNRQIVPSDWVSISTRTHSDIGNGAGYGYMWRTAVNGGLLPNVRLKRPCFFHSGNLLHFLVVIPHRNLVIVHRVNADANGPCPLLHQIGRLFWMILDAADEPEIGDDPSLENAIGKALTGNALTDVLADHRFHLKTPTYLVEGGPQSHIISFERQNRITLDPGQPSTVEGRWTITNDRCCIDMTTVHDCFTLIEDNRHLKFYDATGTLFVSLQYEDK